MVRLAADDDGRRRATRAPTVRRSRAARKIPRLEAVDVLFGEFASDDDAGLVDAVAGWVTALARSPSLVASIRPMES